LKNVHSDPDKYKKQHCSHQMYENPLFPNLFNSQWLIPPTMTANILNDSEFRSQTSSLTGVT